MNSVLFLSLFFVALSFSDKNIQNQLKKSQNQGRFVLYFFSNSDQIVNLKGKTINYIILFTYSLFYTKLLITYVILDVTGGFKTDMHTKLIIIESLSIYIIIIMSTLLYIPIILNIRKNQHLSSVVQFRPDKYVFYQLVFIAGMKTETQRTILQASDMFSTSVFVQVSYLICNKRNMDTLRKTKTFKAIIKLSVMGFFKAQQVQPDTSQNDRSTTVQT
ncbi:hypothetical protein CRE_13015 [Caenorhabditis remanei]|uniref:Uncharacterized protein n=2 Tax=Caenorhabditis remanei TaxID=31234 RepID=E3N7B3_CAERE|nr:hypothetical protein CRE_13015 [Caenorhabditis remanei]